MDLASIFGFGLAIAVVGGLMVLGGDPTIFLDCHSAIIVFGGALAATMIRFPLHAILPAFRSG